MILKNSKSLKKISFILLILSFLSSCGGGDTTTPPPIDTSSSDWNSMVWDQDNWG